MAKPLIGLCDLVSIVSGSSLRWTAIGASARSLPMPFVSIFAFLRELSFFEIRPGMRVEVCPLVGERKPRLKPWPPVSHLLAPGENRCLSEGAASSHSTELMASPFDEAHGKAVLFFFSPHIPPQDELQVDCANRTQHPLVGISGSARS